MSVSYKNINIDFLLHSQHYQRDTVTYPMLITAFLQLNLKVTGSLMARLGLAGFELVTFQFVRNHLIH